MTDHDDDHDDQRDTVRLMLLGGISPERIALALGLSVAEVERMLLQRPDDDGGDPLPPAA